MIYSQNDSFVSFWNSNRVMWGLDVSETLSFLFYNFSWVKDQNLIFKTSLDHVRFADSTISIIE